MKGQRHWDAKAFDKESDPQLAAEIELFSECFGSLEVETKNALCDVGCGTGKFLDWLSNQYPNVKAFGFDNNKDMIAVARSKNGAFRVKKMDAAKNSFDQSSSDYPLLSWLNKSPAHCTRSKISSAENAMLHNRLGKS